MISTFHAIGFYRYVHLFAYTFWVWVAIIDSIERTNHKSMDGVTPYVLPLTTAALFYAQPILEYIAYFGVPRVLTFGLRIPNLLPSKCEAIWPIEGDYAFPCLLDAFEAW